jgi:large subunit ribosomal protein L29
MSKKNNSINELAPAELAAKLTENREKLLQLRLRKQTGQVEKTHELRSLRKDIARLETARTAKTKKAAA